jgi:hypothetical protein
VLPFILEFEGWRLKFVFPTFSLVYSTSHLIQFSCLHLSFAHINIVLEVRILEFESYSLELGVSTLEIIT